MLAIKHCYLLLVQLAMRGWQQWKPKTPLGRSIEVQYSIIYLRKVFKN